MGSTKGTSQLGRYPALLLVRKLGRSRKSMELTPEAKTTPKNIEQHILPPWDFKAVFEQNKSASETGFAIKEREREKKNSPKREAANIPPRNPKWEKRGKERGELFLHFTLFLLLLEPSGSGWLGPRPWGSWNWLPFTYSFPPYSNSTGQPLLGMEVEEN
jgi:hypothetical protein